MVWGLSEAENAPPHSAIKGREIAIKKSKRGWKAKKTGYDCTGQDGQSEYNYNQYPRTVKVSFL